MNYDSERVESINFNDETTNKTDFKIPVNVRTATNFKPKRQCLRVKAGGLKYVHTMTQLNKPLRFDLFLRPKEIVNENPHRVQNIYLKPADAGKPQAILTRPRMVLTPALSMDDIKDDQQRKQVVKDLYKTTMQQDYCERYKKKYKSPSPGVAAPAGFPFRPSLRLPVVPREWRRQTMAWERGLQRSYCDPQREFWTTPADNRYRDNLWK